MTEQHALTEAEIAEMVARATDPTPTNEEQRLMRYEGFRDDCARLAADLRRAREALREIASCHAEQASLWAADGESETAADHRERAAFARAALVTEREPLICTICKAGPLRAAHYCDEKLAETFCGSCFEKEPCQTEHGEGCETKVFEGA